MATKGPRKKPVQLRVIEGNPSKRPIPTNVPKPAPSRPYAPRDMSAEAKVFWDYYAPKLDELGLITKLDRDNLAALCEWTVTFYEANATIREVGLLVKGQRKGDVKKNPAIQIARDASREMTRYSRMFGLSPADRTALEGLGNMTSAGGAAAALAHVLNGSA